MEETKLIKFISLSFLRVLAVLLGAFLLVRVVAPPLMTMQNNFAFFLGAICFPAAIVLILWGGLWVWLAYKKEFPVTTGDEIHPE